MKRSIGSKQLVVNCGFLYLFLVISLSGVSQNLGLMASLGGSNEFSSLTPGYTPSYKPDVSIGATYELATRFRIESILSILSVVGDDSKSTSPGVKNRNLNFKSQIQELALLGQFDLLDKTYNIFVPYVTFGLAVYHFDPHPLNAIDSVGDVDLHSIGTEGQYLPSGKYANRQYKLTQINFQLGGGARFQISDNISIGAELAFRRLSTSYLDDASSKSFISNDEWQAGIVTANNAGNTGLARRLQVAEDYSWREIDLKGNPIPIPMHTNSNGVNFPRGFPNKVDWYYSFQLRIDIKLNVIFGSDLYSPTNPNGRGQLKNPRRIL